MTSHRLLTLTFLGSLMATAAQAEVRFSRLFSDHMVLQRQKPLPVWGWAAPGETVSVSLAGQSQVVQAGADGAFRTTFQPLQTSTTPLTLKAMAKSGEAEVSDVLVGEVWLCSGQSNMEWTVRNSWNGDLEALAADRCRGIRLLTVRTPGTQTAVAEPDKPWELCTTATLPNFSAVGYYFGRQIYDTLSENVPVGLIDNSWGGSACEAWIRRDAMDGKDVFDALLDRWEKIESENSPEKKKEADEKHRTAMDAHKKAMAEWEKAAAEAAKQGQHAPKQPTAPRRGADQMSGNQRPGNLYFGRLKPVLGYAIRGAIWYQGESNAGRAYQYRDMFPLMIDTWRKDWGIGDFPFYWVQLADFKPEVSTPGDSDWAELREAQTMAMKLPNSGQAVIIDLGDADDIHPKQKLEVGRRLARWALAKEYGQKVDFKSPTYSKHEVVKSAVKVTFSEVGTGLRGMDVKKIRGFAIAGADKKWYPAEATIQGADAVLVSSPEVKEPVAVRYAWADNPICNLAGINGLPVTPFRTDDWKGITADAR